MSIRPQRFFASAIIAAIADSRVTSASKAKQSPPACRTSAAVSSASPSSRSTAMTFAPSCANRSAVARPLPMPVPGPCPAPTMIAVFDSSRMSGHDEKSSKGKQRPSASGFVGGGDFVLRQRLAQGRRGTLVEQNAHSGGSQRAPYSVLQNGTDLFNGHAGKPLHELRRRSAVFKVLKERGHGHASTAENPGAADPFRVPLDRRAGGPINHGRNRSTASPGRLMCRAPDSDPRVRGRAEGVPSTMRVKFYARGKEG